MRTFEFALPYEGNDKYVHPSSFYINCSNSTPSKQNTICSKPKQSPSKKVQAKRAKLRQIIEKWFRQFQQTPIQQNNPPKNGLGSPRNHN